MLQNFSLVLFDGDNDENDLINSFSLDTCANNNE